MQWFRFLLAVLLLPATASAQQPVMLVHVHGLAYSADGKRLMIPSHHGLATYENGSWSKAPGPQHDYMGFTATAGGLYSSGHPAPGSGLINPFGLIRSRDGGRTWDKLGLEGETDFHLLAAGWNHNAIYVWNPAPSSRIKQAGLHYTLNEGAEWKRAKSAGLSGSPRALAVHPDSATTMAIATAEGLFVTRNSGEQFKRIATGGEGLAVHFDLDGKHLWYGSFDGRAILARAALEGGKTVPVKLPDLPSDAVSYIAQNPLRRSEYAIATFERSVYLSMDSGRSWLQIAARGETHGSKGGAK